MRGSINGIWLTTPHGKLHPAIIPNLSLWKKNAVVCDFSVVLWTNTDELGEKQIRALKAKKIIVKDYSECSTSSLYKYFLFFLEKGINGDKAAFALASDILRMSILELTSDEEYFIYADPNDISFSSFKKNLHNLSEHMNHNSWGFYYYVQPLLDFFHVRNDVLIALKQINPRFFNDYINAYKEHLKTTYEKYFTPATDEEAQELARQITMQTNTGYFKIILTHENPILRATFGNYKEQLTSVNCMVILPYDRIQKNGNTWLPKKEFLKEKEELSQRKLQYKSGAEGARNKELSTQTIKEKTVVLVNNKPSFFKQKDKNLIKRNEIESESGFSIQDKSAEKNSRIESPCNANISSCKCTLF